MIPIKDVKHFMNFKIDAFAGKEWMLSIIKAQCSTFEFDLQAMLIWFYLADH